MQNKKAFVNQFALMRKLAEKHLEDTLQFEVDR